MFIIMVKIEGELGKKEAELMPSNSSFLDAVDWSILLLLLGHWRILIDGIFEKTMQ